MARIAPMNSVKPPLTVDAVFAGGLEELSETGRKWPIYYDTVEPLAIIADLATIVLVSVFCGLSYHLHEWGTPGDISKSLGAAILVSALFISLMKIRGMYRPTELLLLRNQIRAVCLAWTSVILLLAGAVFALKIWNEIPRDTSLLGLTFRLVRSQSN